VPEEDYISNHTENELCNRIFVVSGYDSVANRLLEHKKTGVYVKFFPGEEDHPAFDASACDSRRSASAWRKFSGSP
jgi:hypothetical protein